MDEQRKPIEQWQAEKQTPAWQFAAAQHLQHQTLEGTTYRWVHGQPVTEPEYDQAIQQVATMKAGY